ncbi:hypothetical protein [Nautilia sp.]
MKKLIILILSTILFASNIVVLKKKEKETNSTIIKEEMFIKNIVINSINSIVPDVLEVTPKEHFLKIKIDYDLKARALKARVNLRVILPSLEKQLTIIKNGNNPTRFRQRNISLKLTPLLRIYNGLPEILIHNTATVTNILNTEINFGETVDVYTVNREIHENTAFTVKKDSLLFKINKSFSSTEPGNMHYYYGTYLYNDYIKFIRIYGFEMGGETDLKPVLYYYKLFFTYRHVLFNKRYMFLEFSPYILFSKEHEYRFKTFANISINFRF